jgi:hypothetical protein
LDAGPGSKRKLWTVVAKGFWWGLEERWDVTLQLAVAGCRWVGRVAVCEFMPAVRDTERPREFCVLLQYGQDAEKRARVFRRWLMCADVR